MYKETLKLLLTLIVSIVVISLTSCNKKNQFDVNFFMPDAKTDGAYVKFISSYGLKKYGIPLDADSVLALTDRLQRQYFGGVGVSGTITIDDDYLIFEPGFGTSLVHEGINEFKIPMTDIDSVHSESFLVITKAVVVNTQNGEFKFQLPKARHFYNPFKFDDEDICNLIKERIKR